MRTIIQVLCLVGIALAADNSTRKSRQIITPFGTPSPILHPHAHNVLDYAHPPHVVGPSVHYIQPTVHSLAPAQIIPPVNVLQATPQIPTGFPQEQSALQRAIGYVQGSLQSVNGPSPPFGSQPDNSQPGFNSQNGPGPQNFQGSPQDSSARFQPPFSQASAGQSNDFNSLSASGSGFDGQQNQYSPSFPSPRFSTPRPFFADDNAPNSQPLITPSQSAEENQRQNSIPFSQQNPSDISGPQSYSRQSPQQFNSPQPQQLNNPFPPQPRFDSPRFQFDSQPSRQFPGNNQGAPNGQQQTQAFIQNNQYGSPGYQRQAPNGFDQSAAILSQTGQISYDGSYSYGFQSDNGIQSSQVGLIRNVGPYSVPVVHGSYSYTAPDGTPISARYFADHTGFHVQGSHVPSPNLQGNALTDLPSPGLQQQFQQPNLAVSVESN